MVGGRLKFFLLGLFRLDIQSRVGMMLDGTIRIP